MRHKTSVVAVKDAANEMAWGRMGSDGSEMLAMGESDPHWGIEKAKGPEDDLAENCPCDAEGAEERSKRAVRCHCEELIQQDVGHSLRYTPEFHYANEKGPLAVQARSSVAQGESDGCAAQRYGAELVASGAELGDRARVEDRA